MHRAGAREEARGKGGRRSPEKIRDLTEDEINHLRQEIEKEGAWKAISAGDSDEHPPADRNSGLSRDPAPPQSAGARPANAHQRAHAQGSAARPVAAKKKYS